MNIYTACAIIEEFDEATTDEQKIEAFQFLIDEGVVWDLQGFYGRTAARLIEEGLCSPQGE